MNRRQSTCDEAALRAILTSVQAEPNEELLSHVEGCLQCQQRLEALAGSNEIGAGIKALTSKVGPVGPRVALPDGLEQAPLHWTETMVRQLLVPSSHPEMLGRLGRYDIERMIGTGGMGIVFRAFDTELNRPVAIKLLAPHLASCAAARKRFSREARAAAAVVHQHVVPIHNVETEQETSFIVMQFVSGESLQARLDREGSLELCEILRIGMQVADGLSAAHQQGLVHRDIKPANILLEEEVDRALVSDFGLARAADDASLTRTGFHPGTPQYMSPEQASGQYVDARSDLFSLGSMLYTMSTGRPPFRAENSLGVLRRITDTEPRPIRELNPGIPDWFCVLVGMLMAKRAEERLQSAAAVRELLEACLRHLQQPNSCSLPQLLCLAQQSTIQVNANTKRSRRRLTFAGAAGVLGLSLMLPFLPAKTQLNQRGTEEPQVNYPGGDKLDQEESFQLEKLVLDNPLVVMGKLGEGMPTGRAFAHLFEPNQILKGNAVDLTVLMSYALSADPDDPLVNRRPASELNPLQPGEYVLVLRAEEVGGPGKPRFSLGFGAAPAPTFNYFVLRDGDKHAAWPKDSPEGKYIQNLFMESPK